MKTINYYTTDKATAYPMNATQPTLIFVHIPKTAGGTLNSIIPRYYPKERIYLHQAGDAAREEFNSLSSSNKNELRAIHGHLYFGIHKELERPYFYVTFLRDPIDRLISAYYFIRERPHHPKYKDAMTLTLQEYYQQGLGGKEQENGQTRILSGQYDTEGRCTPSMLDIAKQNLQEHVNLVGLTERFDESLLMISAALNWQFPFYYQHNVATSRPEKSDIPAEMLTFLQQYNEYDMELYRYGCELFEQQLKQQSANFETRVKVFQTLNQIYAFPFNVAQSLRRSIR